MTLTEYLQGLIAGRIEAAALGDWPRPGASLRRLDPPDPAQPPATTATGRPTEAEAVQVSLDLALSGHIRPRDVDSSALFEPGISMAERKERMDRQRAALEAARQPVEDAIAVWGMDLASTGMSGVHEPFWHRVGHDQPFHTKVTISFGQEQAPAARQAVEALLAQLGADLAQADDRLGNEWWPDLRRA